MAELSDEQRIRILLEVQAEQAAKEAKKFERAVEGIERRYDSTARASRRYERDLRARGKALAGGTITQGRYQAILKDVEREYRTATQTAEVFTNVLGRAGKAAENFGHQVQNMGYQVGDAAVQIAGGTDAMRAISMQLPQMLGGFGVFGAVLGAVVAVGSAIAPMFSDIADAGADAEKVDLSGLQSSMEEIAGLEERLADLHRARAIAQSSASDDIIADIERELAARKILFEFERLLAIKRADALRVELEGLEAQLRAKLEALPRSDGLNTSGDVTYNEVPGARNQQGAIERTYEALAAEKELTDQIALKAAELEVVDVTIGRITDALDGQVDAVRGVVSATREQKTEVERIAGAMNDAYEVYGQTRMESDAALAAAQEMLRTLEDQVLNGIKMRDATDKVAEAARQQAEAQREAFEETLATMEVSEDMKEQLRGSIIVAQNIAAANMAGTIGAAADQASRLASNLARAIAMAPITADMRDEDTVMGQSVIPDASNREAQRRAIENYTRLTTPKATRRLGGGGGGGRSRSGGGGGKSDAQRQLADCELDAKRVYSSTRTAAESYGIELEQLNALHRSGALDPDIFNRAVGKLNEDMQTAQSENVRAAIDGISGSMADAIVESENLRDALGNMAKGAARDMIESSINDMISKLFQPGGGGGILGASSVAAPARRPGPMPHPAPAGSMPRVRRSGAGMSFPSHPAASCLARRCSRWQAVKPASWARPERKRSYR